MSWRVIAKRVAVDPYRTRYLWVELGLFGLFFGLMAYFPSAIEQTLGSVLAASSYMFVSILAIGLSYDLIARRRVNGSIRVMLAYPHSRRDIVIGTAIGRGLVLAGLITFGFLVAIVVSVLKTGMLPAGGPLLSGWLTVLLVGVMMTGLTIGISAGSRTTSRSGITSFIALILFFGLWDTIPRGIRYFLTGGWPSPDVPTPQWELVFRWLNPFKAYHAVAGGLTQTTQGVSGFYASRWFGVLVLLMWLFVPLLIGLLGFEKSDL